MKRIGVILIAVLLSGCEPDVSFNMAKTVQAHAPVEILFKIENNGLETGNQKSVLFPKYNNTDLIDINKNIKPVAEHTYQLFMPGLEAGEYRLVIKLPYKQKFAGLTFFQREKIATYDFTVLGELPGECFSFDKVKNDLQGWTIKGVFVGNREKPIGTATCPGLFYVNHSWPFPLNEPATGGSLFVPVSDACFPKPGQQATQSNHWQISFVSPELANKSEWQQINKITLRIATKTIPVSISPEIHYRAGDTNRSTYLQKELAPRYPLTGGQWVIIDHPVELPAGAKVSRLTLHVSGIPEQTIGKDVDSILLDGICPVK